MPHLDWPALCHVLFWFLWFNCYLIPLCPGQFGIIASRWKLSMSRPASFSWPFCLLSVPCSLLSDDHHITARLGYAVATGKLLICVCLLCLDNWQSPWPGSFFRLFLSVPCPFSFSFFLYLLPVIFLSPSLSLLLSPSLSPSLLLSL